MEKSRFLSSIWVRLIVFLWMIVFPIALIAIPGLEMVMGEREWGLAPAWAFGVWFLGPLVATIVYKYMGGGKKPSA